VSGLGGKRGGSTARFHVVILRSRRAVLVVRIVCWSLQVSGLMRFWINRAEPHPRSGMGTAACGVRGNEVARLGRPQFCGRYAGPSRGHVVGDNQHDDQLRVPIDHILLGRDRPSGPSHHHHHPGIDRVERQDERLQVGGSLMIERDNPVQRGAAGDAGALSGSWAKGRPRTASVFTKRAWASTASLTGLCGFVLLPTARRYLRFFPAGRRAPHQTGGFGYGLSFAAVSISWRDTPL
jgi:hypothetical protein